GDFSAALAGLDYLEGNRIYFSRLASDPSWHEEAAEQASMYADRIAESALRDEISYDTAVDRLTVLGYFAPLWPEELRRPDIALGLGAGDNPVKPELSMEETLGILASAEADDRNYRLGQELLRQENYS